MTVTLLTNTAKTAKISILDVFPIHDKTKSEFQLPSTSSKPTPTDMRVK